MPRKHRPKTVKEEGDLRRNEHGEPVLVVVSQLQLLCHQGVTVGGEEVKLRPSQAFIDSLNSEVLDLVEYCMQQAIDAGRTTLTADDVPKVDNYLPDV